jgi:hypothetical protein
VKGGGYQDGHSGAEEVGHWIPSGRKNRRLEGWVCPTGEGATQPPETRIVLNKVGLSKQPFRLFCFKKHFS